MSQPKSSMQFDQIDSTSELGKLVRAFRKKQGITLEQVSGLSRLSMRFISELERGKETAELGKVLHLLKVIGLDIIIQPRGYATAIQINQDDHHE